MDMGGGESLHLFSFLDFSINFVVSLREVLGQYYISFFGY